MQFEQILHTLGLDINIRPVVCKQVVAGVGPDGAVSVSQTPIGAGGKDGA